MAEISIYCAQNETRLAPTDVIGFFGDAGFGDPISLNSFNGRTFITNISGINQGLEIDNCKLIKDVANWNGINGPSGVIVGQAGSGIGILNLPNYLATLNIRFVNSTSVLVQNAQIIVHNGDQINAPGGLDVYMAEIIHPSELQTDIGIGDFAWLKIAGSSSGLGLSNSPGVSGSFPIAGQDTRHDWYVSISCTPRTPSNKIFYQTISLEYL
jgi:hypothetical protein